MTGHIDASPPVAKLLPKVAPRRIRTASRTKVRFCLKSGPLCERNLYANRLRPVSGNVIG